MKIQILIHRNKWIINHNISLIFGTKLQIHNFLHFFWKLNFGHNLRLSNSNSVCCWAAFFAEKTLLLVWNEKEIYYSPIVRIKDALKCIHCCLKTNLQPKLWHRPDASSNWVESWDNLEDPMTSSWFVHAIWASTKWGRANILR